MSDPASFKQQIKYSVQDFPNAKQGQTGSFFWGESTRGVILPSWGSRERERWLRLFYRHEYNWMGQSAFAGLTKKWASTQWEVSGKYRVNTFQNMLRNGEFGMGWDELIQRVGLDFLRQDGGAYIELIAPGRPDRPPTGRVVGLAHLDSLRCYPTGDPEFPVIYYNRLGKMHLLHRSRVLHLVDAPDGDDANPGYGLCALTRAISIVQQQIHMMRFIETKLDEKPPPGMVVASNINEAQRNLAFDRYVREQSTDESPEWGRTAWFYSIDPSAAAKIDIVSFSEAPEAWSYREYTELHVNAWALALGVDVQELWQLTGGNIGSGAQSQVLHAKSQGRTYGSFLTRLERGMNDVLPDTLNFKFQLRDPFDELERAQVAKIWGEFAAQVAPTMSLDEQRRLLASQVESYEMAVKDESGQIAVLEDVDPETEQQAQEDVAGTNPTQATTSPGRAPGVSTPAPKGQLNGANAAPVQAKAIGDTLAQFQGVFIDLANGVRSGEVDRRRGGLILRAHLSKYGRKAYEDGLLAGGVAGELSNDDLNAINRFNASQSVYVTGFMDTLKDGGYDSDEAVALHARMWANKALEAQFQAGLLSANANGMYQWVVGKAEHCSTCAMLNGQRHRLKAYADRGLLPHSSRLACKGYLCKCSLRRVSGRARGRWPK